MIRAKMPFREVQSGVEAAFMGSIPNAARRLKSNQRLSIAVAGAISMMGFAGA